jgi:hypothetical protein
MPLTFAKGLGARHATPAEWGGSCPPSTISNMRCMISIIAEDAAFIDRIKKHGGDTTTCLQRATELLHVFFNTVEAAAAQISTTEAPHGREASNYIWLALARLATTGQMVVGVIINGKATVSQPLLQANRQARMAYSVQLGSKPTPYALHGGGRDGSATEGKPPRPGEQSPNRGGIKFDCEVHPDKCYPGKTCAYHGDFTGTNNKITAHATADCKTIKDTNSAVHKHMVAKGFKLPTETLSFNAANGISRKRGRSEEAGGNAGAVAAGSAASSGTTASGAAPTGAAAQ